MKKHIIAFLIFSMFAGASAQNYTQVFEGIPAENRQEITDCGML